MKTSVLAVAVAAISLSPLVNAELQASIDGGGLKVTDKEKDIQFQLGGRLQYDYNYASFDDGQNDSIRDESNLDIRRARIYVKGSMGNWGFKSQFNVAEDGADGGSVEDLYVTYQAHEAAKITVGRHKEPLGLEELTSSKDISFLERSATTEMFALGRNTGVSVSGSPANWLHYSTGIFEDADEDGVTDPDQEASHIALTSRLAFTPIQQDGLLLHVAGAFSERENDVTYGGFELALVAGSFHVQYEYMSNDNGDQAGSTEGEYVQLGFIVTGEQRPYEGGKFKKVKPEGKNGAWEIVLRLTQGDGNYSDTELGSTNARESGVGVNWYANNNVRLGATYSVSETKYDNAFGNKDEGEEFRLRSQFTF